MKKLGLFLLIFSQSLFAQTVVPLNSVDLNQVSSDYRPLIVSTEKFRIGLMNDFCESEKSEVNVSREDLVNNLVFYQRELPVLLSRFEALVNELKPGFFVDRPDFYPLQIDLSLDGNEECYNATAEGNHIEIPAQSRSDYMRAVFGLIHHEIGHVLSHFNGEDQNIFDETIADAISLLLFDSKGVFYLGMKEEREEWSRRIELGRRDPHALAAEVGIEYTNVPLWLKENDLKYKCSSDDYYRDMRTNIRLVDTLEGGGESYIVSCAFHSYFRKIGVLWGHEQVLKIFVRNYLLHPGAFNDINVQALLTMMFPGVEHRIFDPGLSRTFLSSGQGQIRTSLRAFNDEEGDHYKLSWNHSETTRDLGIVVFKDAFSGPLASYSMIGKDNKAILTPRDLQECNQDRLLCYCPNGKNSLNIQLAWMEEQGARTLEKAVKLPVNQKECFEITVQEKQKTK